jgi:hypothetical protein
MAGTSLFAAFCLTLIPEPVSACDFGCKPAAPRYQGGGGYRYSSGGGGGGGGGYGAAAGAAIGMLPLAVDVLGGLANTAGEIAATTNLGPSQQDIYDNITAPATPNITLPNPFSILGNNGGTTEPQEAKEDKLPPGCAEKRPWSGTFASRGESRYNEARQAGANADESFAVSDPDTYKDAAKKAREAAEDFACAKNQKARNQATQLANQLDQRAKKRQQAEAKKMIDTANKNWFHLSNRPQVDQIKQEVQSMHDKGMSNKKIIKALESKGYTKDDIKTAVGEMQEVKNNSN